MLYNAKNPHGGDVYGGNIKLDFSANTNPFGMPDAVKRAVSACVCELSRYPDPYCRELVSAIASRENVPEGFVLCGAGAAELIYSFCSAVRTKKAMELAPTFAEYSLALENTGCEIVRHFPREEEGFAVTERLIEDVERERPEALFLCDPNNPTGRLMHPELKLRVAKVCAENGIRLLADECFMDLASGGLSLVPMLSEYGNITVLKAFTKSFGMAGLRLGYCLTSDAELLENMSRQVQPWNVSTVSQKAGTAALCETGFIEKTKAFIEKERPRLVSALRKMGLTVYEPDANFILFRASPSLGERLKERGILIRDCSNFHGLCRGFYRIAVKLPEENETLLEAIKECL